MPASCQLELRLDFPLLKAQIRKGQVNYRCLQVLEPHSVGAEAFSWPHIGKKTLNITFSTYLLGRRSAARVDLVGDPAACLELSGGRLGV